MPELGRQPWVNDGVGCLLGSNQMLLSQEVGTDWARLEGGVPGVVQSIQTPNKMLPKNVCAG